MATFADLDQAGVWNYWFAGRTLAPTPVPLVDPFAEQYKLDHALWFRGGPEVDDEIRRTFEPLVERAAAGELEAWRATPRGCVALLILLDQFPRSMYRGTARAFAHDPQALAIALDALDCGLDRELSPAEALFVLLPLVHAEVIEHVRRGVAGLGELATRCPLLHHKRARSWHTGALKHLDLLQRFGRYPYRNELLGRPSTPAEEAFLAHPEFAALFMRSQAPARPRSSAAPNPAPARRPGPRLRILALHGFRQNGEVFRARIRKLRQALDDVAELVFVTSPTVYSPEREIRDATIAAFGEIPDYPMQRVWWMASEDNSVYRGSDDSIAFLEKVFREQGPFDGVLGFAQGGTLAALLAARLPHPAIKFAFAVCISAYASRARADAAYVEPGRIRVPALHVCGLADLLVTPDRSLKLYETFDPAVATLVKHPGGHFVPNAWPYPAIHAFVERFLDPDAAPAAPPPALDDRLYQELCALIAAAPIDLVRIEAVLDQLAAHGRWKELEAAAVHAHGDGADPAIHRAIVERFAAQLRRDLLGAAALPVHDGDDPGQQRARRVLPLLTGEALEALEAPGEEAWPSACARQAPRIGARPDKLTRIGRDIALAMFPREDMLGFIAACGRHADRPGPDLERQARDLAYQRYRQAISLIGGVLDAIDPEHAARRVRTLRQAKVITPEVITALEHLPISRAVADPEPEPVSPCPLAELDPLLVHLRANAPVERQTAFSRGTLTTDGRLDLCKQVVGPDGIGPLLGAMRATDQIKRLLLGNNIVGDGGAAAIAAFIRERHDSPLDCWYIAGNRIGPVGVRAVCDALASDTKVTSLWLKRNPLKAAGMVPIAELLRRNRTIEVLDLVNCGLLDDGLAILLGALSGPGANQTLRHLYVGTNGVTERSAPRIAEFLAEHSVLESLYLSCNRLGDAGAMIVARGLAANRSLRRFSLASNRIGPTGAAALAAALIEHPSIELFDLGFTKATNTVGELGNYAGDQGARALAEMLAHNRTLRVLDLLHNFISQVGVNYIRDALEVNRTLVALQLTQFGRVHNEPGKEQIRAALERNRGLVPAEQAEHVSKIELPDHIMDIYSVYRTKT